MAGLMRQYTFALLSHLKTTHHANNRKFRPNASSEQLLQFNL